MEKVKLAVILLFVVIYSCLTTSKAKNYSKERFKLMETEFFDSSRNRVIPVALYLPSGKKPHKQPVVIFSHGYGENTPKNNLAYSYLTQNLAGNGYLVASIQHELPTDELLPLQGIPQIVRRSNWERGSEDIRFVLNELKNRY